MRFAAEPDRDIRLFERDAAVACVAMAGVALALGRGRPDGAAGVLAGGALAGVSYWALKGVVGAVVRVAGRVAKEAGAEGGPEAALPAGQRALLAVKFLSRYALLAIGVYVMLTCFRVNPVGLLVGATTPFAAALLQVLYARRDQIAAGLADSIMEKLEHSLWIVQIVNALFGPLVAAALRPLGIEFAPGHDVIPDFIVMSLLILIGMSVLCLFIRSRLSVENPGKLQLALEAAVSFLNGMLDDFVGPKGRNYVTLVGTMFLFILIGNLMGLVPGLKSPTSNINVTLGCALTVFVYYQFHGIKEQGIVSYVKHFLTPPGAPAWIAPIYFPIEVISHMSRVLSLSVRLFGNIFGEDLVIVILASLVPFVLPVPMMVMGLVTSGLQAYIFAMLTTIYLAGAVVVDHGPEGHGADEKGQEAAHAAA